MFEINMENYLGKSTLEKIRSFNLKEIEEEATPTLPRRTSTLADLRTFADFEVRQMWADEVECRYSAESGTPVYVSPENRSEVVGVVYANGVTWERKVRWIDRGLGTRDIYYFAS